MVNIRTDLSEKVREAGTGFIWFRLETRKAVVDAEMNLRIP
jgi:hypothetical protein